MFRKLFILVLALVAIGLALFSYSKFYARKDVSSMPKDVSRMVDEARLTASVKTALALNRHLKNAEIGVSVTDETVSLSGSVGTEIQKQLAGEIVLSIKGVNKLQNNLVVNKLLSLRPDVRERTLGEKLDDLTIEASIKTAFLLNNNIQARSISVSSNRGMVTLTGTVDSPAEADLARTIANDVEGVVSVENKLEAKQAGGNPPAESIGEKIDDVRIAVQVRAALMVNRNVDSSEIEVSSGNGIVTLTGIVHNGAEKDLAQKIVEDCWGVKGVVNELRIK
jgi:hyperosmotically inducible protein